MTSIEVVKRMKRNIVLFFAVLLFVAFNSINPHAASAAESPKTQDILNYALEFKGVKYKYGGNSPSSGFDCSGYILYVYKNFGTDLPRSSAEQFNVGTPIDKDSLKPGDLVFFQNTYKQGISHTGIYLGNNEFISAEDQGVSVASLDNSYWGPKYAGAKRVIETED